jgi:hypothetical protein
MNGPASLPQIGCGANRSEAIMISAPKDISGPNLFKIFLDELGLPRVCRILGVHETTVHRWKRGATPVPKMAVLALYWETQYGRSMIETGLTNEIRVLYRRVRILEDQYIRAKDIITGLRRLHTGTANEPVFQELDDCYAKEGIQAQLGTHTTSQSSAARPQLSPRDKTRPAPGYQRTRKVAA